MENQTTTEVLPVEVKNAMQNLANTLNVETSTKAGIQELADMVASEVKDPVKAIVVLKPVTEFLDQLRKKLLPGAIEIAQERAQTERRLGNMTYDVIEKSTYNYKEDPTCQKLSADLKKRQEQVREIDPLPISVSKTPYIRVNIPKD